MNKTDKGILGVLIAIGVYFALWVGGISLAIYVLWHFIAKYW